jgi:hypothetical protein
MSNGAWWTWKCPRLRLEIERKNGNLSDRGTKMAFWLNMPH